MQITILTNTLYQGNRLLADQVVDMPDEDAKKFCEAKLAVPLFAEDLEKAGFEPLDPEAICDENGNPIEPETEAEETKKPNYHFMKLEDLKKLAEEKGIDVTELKKNEIIALLTNENVDNNGGDNADPEKGNK